MILLCLFYFIFFATPYESLYFLDKTAIIQSSSPQPSSLLKGAIQLAHLVAAATSNSENKLVKNTSKTSDSTIIMPINDEKPQIALSSNGMNYEDFSALICSMVSDIDSVPEHEIKELFHLFDVVSSFFYVKFIYFFQDKYFKDGDGKLSDVESDALNRLIINEVNSLKCAIIIVDFQNDFVNGSLSIKVSL